MQYKLVSEILISIGRLKIHNDDDNVK